MTIERMKNVERQRFAFANNVTDIYSDRMINRVGCYTIKVDI